MTDQAVKDKIKAAVDQVRADLADLESEIPNWNNIDIAGTKKYRPDWRPDRGGRPTAEGAHDAALHAPESGGAG